MCDCPHAPKRVSRLWARLTRLQGAFDAPQKILTGDGNRRAITFGFGQIAGLPMPTANLSFGVLKDGLFVGFAGISATMPSDRITEDDVGDLLYGDIWAHATAATNIVAVATEVLRG